MFEEIMIQKLTMEDYKQVAACYSDLHQRHVQGRPDIYQPLEEILSPKEYQEIIYSEDYAAFGAREGERLAGVVIAKRKVTPENPMLVRNKSLYVDALYVLPQYRRKGVAKQLYEHIEQIAEKEQCQRIDLKVWAFNKEAAAFYEKMGMQVQCLNMEKFL